ncbi:hypothetical protein KM043_010420 [Ampulex compressa]|nr:hypothetical protein KM043_010420 [Ampulex compressa]
MYQISPKDVDDPFQFYKYPKFCNCDTEDCHCGEENVKEWTWDEKHATNAVELSRQNLEVKFHPGYSNGTAAIKGNKPLAKGRHHFWEVKMITPIYGTDVMVGVGTSKADLTSTREMFCSLLGYDQESWGFSYRGYIQHDGRARKYTSCFGQGSIVGIHLDTWRGTLQFFINRKPLGIAFCGLKEMLYPMVSSTAAQIIMRITYSCSIPASLQTDCLAILRPLQKAYLSTAFPGLRYLSQSVFAEILHKDIDEQDEYEMEFPAEYTILDDFDFVLVGLGRKRKKKFLDKK